MTAMEFLLWISAVLFHREMLHNDRSIVMQRSQVERHSQPQVLPPLGRGEG
jgi:hypothetical protein